MYMYLVFASVTQHIIAVYVKLYVILKIGLLLAVTPCD